MKLPINQIIQGDCLEVLKTLPDNSVQCCITSPPYWGLRDYGVGGQLGLEKTPEEYVAKMVNVFREVKRVLREDGTLWLNLGDSYTSGIKGSGGKSEKQDSNVGSRYNFKCIPDTKPKDLVGIPWRVAFALQEDGWYLRQDIIWHKPNPMPESVTDRCTKSHEYIFLLTKNASYYFDNEAIREPIKPTSGKINGAPLMGKHRLNEGGRRTETRTYNEIKGANKRSVWTVTTKPFKEAHFATFPEELIKPMVLAGTKEGDIILDPFFGAGTTGVVASKLGRKYVGIELNHAYIVIAQKRINTVSDQFGLLELGVSL